MMMSFTVFPPRIIGSTVLLIRANDVQQVGSVVVQHRLQGPWEFALLPPGRLQSESLRDLHEIRIGLFVVSTISGDPTAFRVINGSQIRMSPVPFRNLSSHCITMPRCWLFSSNVFTGRLATFQRRQLLQFINMRSSPNRRYR